MKNESREELAQVVRAAMFKLVNDEEAMYNFTLYLSYHFDFWIEKMARTPEDFAFELKSFSEMFD